MNPIAAALLFGGESGGSSDPIVASSVTYDNTSSGLSSENVQDAIDEVNEKIEEQPNPMVYKGTLGTGGTITSLPAASPANEGHVYKVKTEDDYILDTVYYRVAFLVSTGNVSADKSMDPDFSNIVDSVSVAAPRYNGVAFVFDDNKLEIGTKDATGSFGGNIYVKSLIDGVHYNNNIYDAGEIMASGNKASNRNWGPITYGPSIHAKVGDMFISNGAEWTHIPSGDDMVIADEVTYDNTTSALVSENVQDAIDEVNTKVHTLGGVDGIFVDTENVIQDNVDIPVNSTESYTATEDCCVRTKLWCNGNNQASEILIDNVVVGTIYNVNGAVYYLHYLKKGQTISFSVSAESSYTVYGIQTGTTHSKFQPVIYSLEEREVGVWTDGKPLYQKTVYIDKTEIISGRFISLPHGIENIDMIIDAEAFAGQGLDSEFPYFMPNRLFGSESATIQENIVFVYEGCNTTNLRFTIGSTWTAEPYAIQYIYATISYTKTTDTPGSGTWTPQGVPAHHYSTDEQIIGTWVDGSTLYEKTFDLGSNVDISNWQWTESGITISNLDKIIEAKSTNTSGTVYPLMAYHTNGVVNLLACRDSQPASSRWLILQYTKNVG